MADLIGKDFTPPDIRGKVTGSAKYAEDFRMDGMVFCRLLTSPIEEHHVITGGKSHDPHVMRLGRVDADALGA